MCSYTFLQSIPCRIEYIVHHGVQLRNVNNALL